MKQKILIAVLSVFVLVGLCYSITVNPASNALADSANTALTIIYRDANGAFAAGAVTVTSLISSGGATFASKTVAQLQALVPAAAGETYYCSNCSTAGLATSTGTSAGNFVTVGLTQFK